MPAPRQARRRAGLARIAMLIHRRSVPDPALRTVVRQFSQRQCLDAHRHVAPFALPARTEQFIEFYLAEAYRVSVGSGTPEAAPQIAVVGPHRSYGKRLHMVGDVNNFTVHFTPTGFHRLFGSTMIDVCDTAVHAADLLRARIWPWYDALQRATSFDDRIRVSTAFLGAALADARAADSIDWAAGQIVRTKGAASVRELATAAGWSERHLTRSLTQRTGLAPKLFARLTRFHALLGARAAAPDASLTSLALDAGYFDQAHFIRDCREFTGAAPVAFLRDWEELQASRS